ncbi:hypothetical protein P4S70_16740, partial [Enterovibrio sp. Hal110]
VQLYTSIPELFNRFAFIVKRFRVFRAPLQRNAIVLNTINEMLFSQRFALLTERRRLGKSHSNAAIMMKMEKKENKRNTVS